MARLKILSNERIGEGFYKISLQGDTKEFVAGQFVNISIGNISGMILKRPISVYEVEGNIITLIYEIRGKGTKALSELQCGELDALYFLGNGFKLSDKEKKVMLIGGGVGVAPLYSIMKKYSDREFYSYLGFANKDKVILEKEFSKLSTTVITTDDGSYGKCGYVTAHAIADIEKIKPDIILSCGPKPMLKVLDAIENIKVLVSIEERMGCGIGACLVCTCETVDGNKRVCKDGPVFDIKELKL